MDADTKLAANSLSKSSREAKVKVLKPIGAAEPIITIILFKPSR